MPEPFRKLTVEQFARMIEIFPWRRKIETVHVHHTWRPNHSQWKGLESVRGMWRFHTKTNGWSDIAQHLSIGRDGDIWTGRNWNVAPASAGGFNGNPNVGPFMIEMNGDFDEGKDTLQGDQLEAVASVVALLLRRFGLTTAAIRFHREMNSPKTCPGTSIKKDWFAGEVQKRLEALGDSLPVTEGPFDTDLLESWCLEVGGSRAAARDEGELPEDSATYAESRGGDEASRGDRLTPEQLTALIPHVVNMREGKFASTELFHSDESTVDAIFAALDSRAAAAQPNAPLRIVLWAHGGLKTEHGGLEIAHKHVWWWTRNGVYPIYFVWETGLFQTIGDTVRRAIDRLRGRRAIDFAAPTDFLIEKLVRPLGVHTWGGMKFSASEASKPGNAADIVADRLDKLLTKHPGKVQLHAIGHSAGAIFHSHFVRNVLDRGAAFETLQLLAPAVRIEDFVDRLGQQMGNGIARTTIFTMFKQFELADNVAKAYRKSLLYLISRALEANTTEAAILGLEESMRRSPAIVSAFGLNGQPANGRVFFSKSAETQADEHGEFDDDPDTMNSVGRLVLGGQNVAVPYPPPAPGKRSLSDLDVELPPEVEELLAAAPPVVVPPPAPSPTISIVQPAAPTAGAPAYGGRRRALCVGINDYPSAPLRGCVADARLWASQLQAIGFSDVKLLTDAQASRRAIIGELESLLGSSQPGDVIVFQAAGHGTSLPDLDGDDESGTDEAFLPHDYEGGGFLIDDDFAGIFTRIPQGVLLTCFFDFCHSGTGTRLAVGTANAARTSDERSRFIVAVAQLIQAHAEFRRSTGTLGASRSANRGPDFMREVVFSACRPDEEALERGGQGDFTRNVAPLLAQWQGRTNQQFQDLLTSGFTPAGRQHPILDCSPAARNQAFLGGTGTGARSGGGNAIAQLLRDVAAVVEGQSGR